MNAADANLVVKFYVEAMKDMPASMREGRAVFKEAELCEIRLPGDPRTVVVVPAHDRVLNNGKDPETGQFLSYAERFKRQYEAFKDKRQMMQEGTPLVLLPGIDTAKVAEFAALNVHTIETLASLDGAKLQKLGMHAGDWKNRAMAFIDKTKGAAIAESFAAENASLKGEIEALKAQMSALSGGAPVNLPTLPAVEPASDEPTPFDGWDSDNLKAFITDRTGKRPAGNPSVKTLKAQAMKIVADQQEAA